MRSRSAHTVDDMRRLARRAMPRFAFDYFDGGAGDEANLRRNISAFEQVCLRPRYLRDVSARSLDVDLFGKRYGGPIGIAPVGLANLAGPGTDLAFARAAAQRNVPHVLSTAATTAIEAVAPAAEGRMWFQLYVSSDQAMTGDLMRRARAVGVETLVVTVDVPAPGRRLRDLRNGFGVPLKLTPRAILDLAAHPRWSLAVARHGQPTLENLKSYGGIGATPQAMAAIMQSHLAPGLDADGVRRLRDAWQGSFVIKGLLDPEDAETAVAIGAEGVIVSNHGGRQCDAAPAAIEALPAVVAAVGGRCTVMLDSGVRSGLDVVRAYALGARYVFSGRCFLYGAAADGAAGVRRVFEILEQDADQTLAQLGCPDMRDMGPAYLWQQG